MRHLILMRHGKATDDRAGRDHDRRLATLGVSDVQEIGSALAKLNLTPDRVLCSDSARTRETADAMGLGELSTVLDMPELYLAGASQIAHVIGDAAESASVVLVVGHNPGIEELMQRIDPNTGRVKPGTALVCRINGEWRHFTPRETKAVTLLVPHRYQR